MIRIKVGQSSLYYIDCGKFHLHAIDVHKRREEEEEEEDESSGKAFKLFNSEEIKQL